MRYGIVVNAGTPRQIAALAHEAEDTGWDGVFTYDAIAIGTDDLYDPWTLLAALAMTTTRVTLGAIVFAPTRRRPWKLAREALTVDHLSGGRLVVPVGLGALDDLGFANVGEVTAARDRAAILDETLEILAGLWTGGPFEHHGARYAFGPMTLLPRPVQQPRIPIWVVAVWPHRRSIERALRWDGMVLQTDDPSEVAAIAADARRRRAELGRPEPFELVAQGSSPPEAVAAGAAVRPLADAGATWWIEADWHEPTLERVRARVLAGPPRAG